MAVYFIPQSAPPTCYKGGPQLGSWAHLQQRLLANNELRADRRARLESIGFAWVAGEAVTKRQRQWEVVFERLEARCRQRGDCLALQEHKEGPALGKWVSHQRKRRAELGSARVARLESIGFVWSPFDQQWEEMLQRLAERRRQARGCLAPADCKVDPALGRWAHAQRAFCSRQLGLSVVKAL